MTERKSLVLGLTVWLTSGQSLRERYQRGKKRGGEEVIIKQEMNSDMTQFPRTYATGWTTSSGGGLTGASAAAAAAAKV